MPITSPCEDIKSLIERHANIQVVSDSIVHGVREYHSNCPWCGGKDRFITRPEDGQYSCAIRSSGCGRVGDMLDFLMDYCNMSMREAIEEIGLDADDVDFYVQERNTERSLARIEAPSKKWQEQGNIFVDFLNQRQYLQRDEEARAFLHERGFTDETIQTFGLQYIPTWAKTSAELWGLDANDYPDGEVKAPEGLLIPWRGDGQLWKLEVRRTKNLLLGKDGRTIRYMPLAGSKEHVLFNMDAITPDKPVVLVESALDAIAGMQVCGDIAPFVATGGTGKAHDEHWMDLVNRASFALIAFDDDEAGDKGSEPWKAGLSKVIRWAPWGDGVKDINDMLLKNEDMRYWLEAGMKAYKRRQEAKNIPVSTIQSPDPVQPIPPAPADPGRETEKPYPALDLAQIISITQKLQRAGVQLEVRENNLYFEADFTLSLKVRRFLYNSQKAIVSYLQGPHYAAAKAFYRKFCSQSGYYLRLNNAGQIAIGVPETLTDEEFEQIAEQICSYGEPLLQVIKDLSSIHKLVIA